MLVVVTAAAAVMFVSAAPAPAETPVDVEGPGDALWNAQVSLDAGPESVVDGSGEWATVSKLSIRSGAAQTVAESVGAPVGAPEVTVQSSGGWWNGAAVLATDAPVFVEQGSCPSFGDGGFMALLTGAKLSKGCAGDGLSGSVRGVGWFEGHDSDGPFVAVVLVGAPGLAESVYQALGTLDVVFDGGTFTADFTKCEHQTESTFSSCQAVISGASLPPGALVGVATAGTDPPSRSVRSTDDTPATPAAERAALVALYDATDGANWTRNTNWNTTAAVSTWYGVTTNNTGSVTDLYMFRNGLSGTIPAELGNLTNLERLDLNWNGLSGNIPVELGNLANLTVLALGGHNFQNRNNLSGGIPSELGNLTNLERLDLGPSGLSGAIPTELGNLTNLTGLSLDSTDLSGGIPSELGNLTNLEYLDLSRSGLSGAIPTELGNLTNLTNLNLGHIGLSGTIPTELGDLTSLRILNLFGNNLSGSIPPELGDLTNLWQLGLARNSLSGNIPSELGNITALAGLNFGGNSFSGSIPAEFGNLTNLTYLDLRSNNLWGSIPPQLGDLTKLNELQLSFNDLSGSIPSEIGKLIKLSTLDLSSNSLSGAIPSELGNLANLTSLDLRGNSLSGCVPDALLTVRYVQFGPTLGYCGAAIVTPTNGRARESDGVVVFTLVVVPPRMSGLSPASVDYTTVAGLAQAGTDFTPTSGTLTIPAGARFVTVSVPLVDDSTAEFDEGISLLLSNPVGARVNHPRVWAKIYDDDRGLPDRFVPAEVCPDADVEGSVTDVFEQTQVGFNQWHHVFVDVDLDCGGRLTSGVGYPIAVQVIYGPADSLGLSGHCLTAVGSVKVTASRATALGCRTFAAPGVSQLSQSGRSTHILRIPDSAVGEDHQIRVWVDVDGDGVRDAGEESHIFAADFVSRAETADGLAFGLAEDFEVVNLGRSDRLWRAGELVELRLAAYLVTGELVYDPLLSRPVPERWPLTNSQLGAFVYTGPSRTAEVMCVMPGAPGSLSPGYSRSCVTDAGGYVTLRYRVQPTSVTSGPQQDDVRIYWDRDGDGILDGAPNHPAREPSDTIQVQIAKAVNYVALGDSYSSGEQGRDREGLKGEYLSEPSRPADGQCRRWSLAYPAIIDEDFLGNDALGITVEFTTFACTGAKTHNIYDPADPDGTPLTPGVVYDYNNPPPTAHDTDRPSDAASLGRPIFVQSPPMNGVPGNLLEPILAQPRSLTWEPRQAVSLAGVQEMLGVDMVTVTIGGNDAGFGAVLARCVARVPVSFDGAPVSLDGTCTEDDLPLDYGVVEDRVVSVLGEVRRVAPGAVVFVLGYPHATPLLMECAEPTYRRTGRPGPGSVVVVHESPACERQWDAYRKLIRDCGSYDARKVIASDKEAAAAVILTELIIGGSLYTAFDLGGDQARIDYVEAQFLSSQAARLNEVVESAAGRAGVHFVDVMGSGAGSFVGHSPCDLAEPWMVGFDPAGHSFHPNAMGHGAAARILEEYIRGELKDSRAGQVTEAGLPANPGPSAEASGVSEHRSSGSGQQSGDTAKTSSEPFSDAGYRAATENDEPVGSVGYLFQQRVGSVSGCGAAFVSPGEQVRLLAGGFAADATVSFTAQAVSLGEAVLSAPAVADASADADGELDVLWSVPAAPAVTVDAAPRAYAVTATGANPDGATHTAKMIVPLVAYPAAGPCAADDAVATVLGQPAQIAVLANDTAPAGGTWDVSSVRVRPAHGGAFTTDDTTGAVTFTPDTGFWGTVETTYVVYDEWGIGVEAALSVRVDAGCTITGTADLVLIEGTEGDDVICVPDRDDYRAFHIIDAKGGNDTVLGGAGEEWIYGGDGTDTIYGNGGVDEVIAGAGVDTVYGGSGMDRIYSVDTADTVIDDDYEMVLSPLVTATQSGPEPADDWVWADVSATVEVDVLGNDHDPNEDLDPASLRVTQAPTFGTAVIGESADGMVVVEYTAAAVGGADRFVYEVCDTLGNCATGVVTVMVGTSGCTIVGTDADETLFGTAGDDVICGLGGNDVIYGLGGDDIIVGGAGDDTSYGGDSTLIGATDGDDLLWGGTGDDTLYGGNGVDVLYGNDGADGLYGNRRDDVIMGGPGDDTVVGGGENDRIYGGSGADDLDGHAGDDMIWGGPGADVLRGGNGDDVLWGNTGDDTLIGGAGADRLHGGSGDDRLDGNTQDDVLWGGPGADILDGKGHDDQLLGGAGADTLRGGGGDDRVYGGPGDDVLDGGNGVDHLDGGGGVDSCRRSGTVAGCETAGRL